jgi:hypothetical protein
MAIRQQLLETDTPAARLDVLKGILSDAGMTS